MRIFNSYEIFTIVNINVVFKIDSIVYDEIPVSIFRVER
jgi:hypothetical protein